MRPWTLFSPKKPCPLKQDIRLRLLSYGVIAYMLMAFTWWSVLLFTKNQDAFLAKRDLLKIGMVAEGLVQSEQEFLLTERYQELRQSYRRQEWMIFGEAFVFIISLLIGLWFINRGYNKEVSAARQRRNFLLSITHELKSPIASVRLVLETLLHRRLDREKTDKLSRNALAEIDRLNGLVNDLLLSARLETAYQPHQEDLDLAELLTDLVRKMQTKYPRAHIVLHQEDPIPVITGDKMGMTSVALNLLENAVKYSQGPPRIDIRLGMAGDRIRLEVADHGIGIEEKEKSKIFEKFYRVGNEDTRQTKGTGLGLYIVSEIIRSHGGDITVLDNQPRGAVFRIDLPAYGTPPESRKQRKEKAT